MLHYYLILYFLSKYIYLNIFNICRKPFFSVLPYILDRFHAVMDSTDIFYFLVKGLYYLHRGNGRYWKADSYVEIQKMCDKYNSKIVFKELICTITPGHYDYQNL